VRPKAGGRRVADQAARKFPDIKVLYMSGYTDDSVVVNGVLDAEIDFLQKPFSTDALVRKVRQVLDEKRGEGRG
jgi:DNA-binding NtrC family response regulator